MGTRGRLERGRGPSSSLNSAGTLKMTGATKWRQLGARLPGGTSPGLAPYGWLRLGFSVLEGHFLLFSPTPFVHPEGIELDSQNLSPNSFSKNCRCTLTFNLESSESVAVKAVGTQGRSSWCGGLLALWESSRQEPG